MTAPQSIPAPHVYAISRAVELLDAALDADLRRRWWQLPNRLWVGRTLHARNLLAFAISVERRELFADGTEGQA